MSSGSKIDCARRFTDPNEGGWSGLIERRVRGDCVEDKKTVPIQRTDLTRGTGYVLIYIYVYISSLPLPKSFQLTEQTRKKIPLLARVIVSVC